jgi:hypothetical protein
LRRSALVPAIVLACLAAGGPDAGATTIQPLSPCFAAVPNNGSQTVRLALSGGRPGGEYRVDAGGGKLQSAAGTFDDSGSTLAELGEFELDDEEATKGVKVPVRVTEGGVVTAVTQITLTNVAFSVSSKGFTFHPFRTRTWRISGLTPAYGSGPLYASWVKVKNNRIGSRVVKRKRLGTPQGPCGYLTIKRMLPPIRKYTRQWYLYIHVGRNLHKRQAVSRSLNIF